MKHDHNDADNDKTSNEKTKQKQTVAYSLQLQKIYLSSLFVRWGNISWV